MCPGVFALVDSLHCFCHLLVSLLTCTVSLPVVLHADDELHAVASGRPLEKREVELLKYALAAGLYPQFAVPDKLNGFRKIAEQVGHVDSICFVSTHLLDDAWNLLTPVIVLVSITSRFQRSNHVDMNRGFASLDVLVCHARLQG